MKHLSFLLASALLVGCAGLPRGTHPLTHPALINESDGVHLTLPGITVDTSRRPAPLPKNSDSTEVDLVDVTCTVMFSFDSAALSPEMKQGLDSVVTFLHKTGSDRLGHMSIAIDGHASSDGDPSYNKKLSLRRAQAVADYLRKAGLSDATFDVKGLGAPAPTPQNSTPAARAADRNAAVEIDIRGRMP